MNKKTLIISSLLISLILISSVLAITASIGNAKMILRAQTGDTIEKSILVKNVNDVPVNIALTASGDLEKFIIIKDNNFTLQPKEEKDAAFTIKVTTSGTTETKINVQFTPVGEKNGAGLSSTIMVIATGENLTETDLKLSIFKDKVLEDTRTGDNSSNSVKTSIGAKIKIGSVDKKVLVVLITTSMTFLAFIILLFVYYKKSKGKFKIKNRQTIIIKTSNSKEKRKIKHQKSIKKRD
ncbi:MAG: hypothetical protein WCX73_02100 [Candidatus Pacearchaeota archaeon]|jgi:hypothetical protein